MNSEVQETVWEKSKVIAMLLAVFLGPVTWLYTYRRDPGKATVGVGSAVLITLYFAPLGLVFREFFSKPHVTSMANESLAYALIGFIVLLPFILAPWYLSIITTAMQKQWHLEGPDVRTKRDAILYAAFLGPWTWLYTYKRDCWKFWPAILIGLSGYLAWESGKLPDPLLWLWLTACFAIWAGSLASAILRKSEWYSTYGRSASKRST